MICMVSHIFELVAIRFSDQLVQSDQTPLYRLIFSRLGMACKGICHRYKATRAGNQPRYSNGQKRCNTCETFLYCDGFLCPCCGRILRSKPRDSEHKRKFFAQEFKTIEIC